MAVTLVPAVARPAPRRARASTKTFAQLLARALARLAVGALVSAVGCRPPSPPPTTATLWVTEGEGRARLAPLSVDHVAPARVRADSGIVTVRVFSDSLRQLFIGVGAALTDASAQIIGQLPRPRRDSLWRALFTRDGAGLGVLRIPLGASDFSTRFYSYADTAGVARADLAPDTAQRLPLLRDARRQRPTLALFLTPWSAPAWMKSTGSLIGGTLRADAESTYVQYLLSALEGFEAHGVPAYALSLQNEPGFAPSDYPGMQLSATQRARLIGRWLGPALRARRTRVQLLEWDHNWDRPEEPLAVLADSLARRYVDGVAWHCYAGDVSAQRRVRAAAPSVDAYFTECSGGAWAPHFGDNLVWNATTLLVGAVAADARAVVLWNLALDPEGGPHRGGCNDCRGVLTIDSARGTITPNVEYWVLAHVGRFVDRGDRRVVAGTSSAEVPAVAFRRERDGARVVVLVNTRREAIRVDLVDGATHVRATIPARALVTAVLGAAGGD